MIKITSGMRRMVNDTEFFHIVKAVVEAMTLDDAVAQFRAKPNARTATALRAIATEYADAGMIEDDTRDRYFSETDTNIDKYRDMRERMIKARDAARDVHVTKVTQAVERMLLTFGIHLDTDRYNDLDDYLRSLITAIEENGQ